MKKEYDLIVAGGGLTGVAAAVSALRSGLKKVLLIERYGFLGGMATSGLVHPFMSHYKSFTEPTSENQLTFGIFQEIFERMQKLNGAEKREVWYFDAEAMKLVLNQLVKEAGVDLLLHTYVTDVYRDEDKIESIKIVNKSGTTSLKSQLYIDATGDADLAYHAGVPCAKGREQDGLAQPMTLCFRLGNVDEDKLPSREEINKLYKEARERGELSNPREDVLFFKTLQKGVIHFNSTRVVKKDPTSAEDLTRAELIAREQAWNLYQFLKEKVPGFKNSYFQISAPQIGVRESRRIIGEYTLTADDVLEGRKFADSIAYCAYMIDIHSPAGEGTEMKHLPRGEFYGIPYRCLLPRKITNVLVAGRPISSTHEAHSSLRIMPTCTALGQAAGTAAAMALKANIMPGELDGKEIRQLLIKDKAIRNYNT